MALFGVFVEPREIGSEHGPEALHFTVGNIRGGRKMFLGTFWVSAGANKGIADDGFVKCTVRASARFGKLWTARHCQNRSEGFARMAYFSQVREGEGVRHREIPFRVLFFVRRLFCRETSVPVMKAQHNFPTVIIFRRSAKIF